MNAFDATGLDNAAFDTPAIILSLPVVVDVSAREIATLAVRVSVFGAPISTDGGTTAASWALLVTIRAADESGNVVGAVTIEAEENATRVADLALHMPDESQLSENGKAVSAPIAVTGESLGSLVVEMGDEALA